MNITYKYETKFLSLYLTEDMKWNAPIKILSCKLIDIIM
jgi:hypothetical protein